MAFKKEKLEKILEREISNLIAKDAKDKRLQFITVTKIDVTADLSLATVYFTAYGDADEIKATVAALYAAKGFIKTALSKRLSVRKVPDLRFKYDDSFARGNRIEAILKNLE